jgi:hypothetical protein
MVAGTSSEFKLLMEGRAGCELWFETIDSDGPLVVLALRPVAARSPRYCEQL